MRLFSFVFPLNFDVQIVALIGHGEIGKPDFFERGDHDVAAVGDAARVMRVGGEGNHSPAQLEVPLQNIRIGDKGAARRLGARIHLEYFASGDDAL